MLENTIKKILSIDNDAKLYKESTNKLLNTKKEEFEKEMNKLKENFNEGLEIERRTILDESIKKANITAKQIIYEKDKEIDRIIKNFEGLKAIIINSLFKHLSDSMKEG